ncbi:hypothetical protein [Saccharopolyspora elongata]|uniref:Uncharacterized protein n=1 Tax=Saccharopolyspora elongata TaxID=2530387 RepID=A0A4R4XSH9_9PSEU|nr:hypothetical protein [Saccharopolyspora elongata]TDD34448.1 hypothetical protein E1288_44370 [Saccharopolyspora elongata]
MLETVKRPEDAGLVLRQLETEMSDARESTGNEQAAQLHVVWIDLLLDEWSRYRLAVQRY